MVENGTDAAGETYISVTGRWRQAGRRRRRRRWGLHAWAELTVSFVRLRRGHRPNSMTMAAHGHRDEGQLPRSTVTADDNTAAKTTPSWT